MVWLTLDTCNTIRIACVTSFAGAIASVIASTTVSIQCTITRVLAFLVATSKMIWTVRINQALIWAANVIGASFVIVSAVTHSFVIFGFAQGIGATLLKETGILTFAADASLVIRALKVSLAAS